MKRTLIFVLLSVALVTTACGDDSDPVAAGDAVSDDPAGGGDGCLSDSDVAPIELTDTDLGGTAITLATHDSFALSDGVLDAFTAQTGIDVTQVAQGDAGQMVSSAILTADNPTADVMYGIDNSLMCRGLEADLFLPYVSSTLDDVDDSLELDQGHRLTPINFGDVCANYWTDALPGEPPATLDDLIDPVNANQFVTQSPETSSPGLSFLLATIARYGEDGWEAYWQSLADNGVAVTAGWEDAYYGDFAAGGGDRSIVMSYASSPAAEVLFADPPIDSPPTGVLFDGCFRQIEFAGVLSGTEQPEAAARLVDFLLSTEVQEDIPLNMFVYPALSSAQLPDVFVEFAALSDDPLTLDPDVIEANRDRWTDRWNQIMRG